MKIKQRIASVVFALGLMGGGGLILATPAQAHTTTQTHYGSCFVALDGTYWCQRHCSYIERTYYGCTNNWWYWNWWAA